MCISTHTNTITNQKYASSQLKCSQAIWRAILSAKTLISAYVMRIWLIYNLNPFATCETLGRNLTNSTFNEEIGDDFLMKRAKDSNTDAITADLQTKSDKLRCPHARMPAYMFQEK